LAKLKATAQISNVDDNEKYSESVIQPAIDQLEKLDFYQDHLNMLDLWRNKPQDEGMKGFEASLANSPICYYREFTLSFRLKYCRLVIIWNG
jgi:hypothetical protein